MKSGDSSYNGRFSKMSKWKVSDPMEESALIDFNSTQKLMDS